MREMDCLMHVLFHRRTMALLTAASLMLAGCAQPTDPAAATPTDATSTAHPILLQATALRRGHADDLPAELVLSGSGHQVTAEATSWRATTVHTGLWSGDVGTYRVDSYPDNEVFTVLTGAIDLVSTDGSRVDVRPGAGVFVPRGWKGLWHTLAPTTKTFVITD